MVALKKASRKLITQQQQAAEEMGVTARHLRRLLNRLKQEREKVVIHALRGNPSNLCLLGISHYMRKNLSVPAIRAFLRLVVDAVCLLPAVASADPWRPRDGQLRFLDLATQVAGLLPKREVLQPEGGPGFGNVRGDGAHQVEGRQPNERTER